MADTGSELADAVAIAEAKKLLRSAIRLRRDARAAEQREDDDERRFELLRALLVERAPRRVAAYLSTGTEPDSLRPVAWAAAHDIEVLLPVLTDGSGAWLSRPAWAVYQGPDRLREGRAGILEPTSPLLGEDAVEGTDLMIVPGLAADLAGNRLGRGGGWYDRARAGHAELETCLLLNDDEVLEVVPTDSWDLPVDLVITPSRVVRRSGRPSDHGI